MVQNTGEQRFTVQMELRVAMCARSQHVMFVYTPSVNATVLALFWLPASIQTCSQASQEVARRTNITSPTNYASLTLRSILA